MEGDSTGGDFRNNPNEMIPEVRSEKGKKKRKLGMKKRQAEKVEKARKISTKEGQGGVGLQEPHVDSGLRR